MPVNATPTGTLDGCTADGAPQSTLPESAPVSCVGQHILVPREPTEPTTGTQILSRMRAVEIPGRQKAVIEHTMRDSSGVPVDLSNCLCEEGSLSISAASAESASAACPCPWKLVFRLNEYLSGGSGVEYPVTVVDAATGKVQVEIAEADTSVPGVYFGQFALVECTDDPDDQDIVLFSNHIYVNIGRSLWNNASGAAGPSGPPTIAEIRMHLRDTDPSESFLLDNLAFSDEEIMQAIWLPVQYWNEIPPPIPPLYTTASFPYRYHWLIGVTGYLFMMVAEQYRRNNLQYNAGGVAVNDQAKAPDYDKAADRRIGEFQNFVRRKKAQLNLESAFGEVGSPYGYRYGH